MEKIIRFGISVIDFDPEGRRRPVDRSGVHAVRGDRRYVFFCGVKVGPEAVGTIADGGID